MAETLPSHSEIRHRVLTHLTVPIWPESGIALDLSRNAAYAAAKRGDIPTIRIGGRFPVPTAWLRRVLQIDDQEAEKVAGTEPGANVAHPSTPDAKDAA